MTDSTFLKQDNIRQKVTYGNMAAWVKDELKEEAGNGVLGSESDLADMKEKLIGHQTRRQGSNKHCETGSQKQEKVKARNVDVKRTNKFAQSYNSERLLKEYIYFPKQEGNNHQNLVDAMEMYIDEMLLVEDVLPAPVAVVEDCRECDNCRDKKRKHGGPYTRKQSCVLKPVAFRKC